MHYRHETKTQIRMSQEAPCPGGVPGAVGSVSILSGWQIVRRWVIFLLPEDLSSGVRNNRKFIIIFYLGEPTILHFA